jgi:hypothetical protein
MANSGIFMPLAYNGFGEAAISLRQKKSMFLYKYNKINNLSVWRGTHVKLPILAGNFGSQHASYLANMRRPIFRPSC